MTSRISCALLLAALTAGCDINVGEKGVSLGITEGKASDEWTRSYTLARGGALEIVNSDGTIEVFPSTGSQVEVRVTRELRMRSDEEAKRRLEELTIAEEVAPERVKVETSQPERGTFRGRYRVEYRVNIPPGLNVSLRSQNGGVRLENVNGHITAASTNGGITGRGISGSIDASTVNGGIILGLDAIDADVRIVTVNGGIRLDLPRDFNAILEASAVNGGIVVQDGFPLEASERARLRVAGRINKGGPKLVVQTTNGGIRINEETRSGEPREQPEQLQHLEAR